jgi:hypothetical protein
MDVNFLVDQSLIQLCFFSRRKLCKHLMNTKINYGSSLVLSWLSKIMIMSLNELY